MYAFGDCKNQHSIRCQQCDKLFHLFEQIETLLPSEHSQKLIEYKEKLCFFLAHQARKVYLNTQFQAEILNLDEKDALILADYKMKILEKKMTRRLRFRHLTIDNRGHYHSSEVMAVVSNWYQWYTIEVKDWYFFEAGEAKLLVDSYYATILYAIARYVRVGHDLDSGEKIQEAIQDLGELGLHILSLFTIM
ncbi:1124_t:CDS:2 [Acaulospora morrowiae]|uniref:1124_t:CDS:1 n=1 Tax=Acaulospora morrowiae TaxID=94023 RepID=A0A9N9IBM5_9GLOM|nr:1124_t:CDS:2 [Acaulospora morrowiae]